MKTDKRYPFSIQKHGHDIEFYNNRLHNIMGAMRNGEMPYDEIRYNRIEKMCYGELSDLMDALHGFTDGKTVYLTGQQIELAKRIVAWAYNERLNRCKPEYQKYC